MAWLHYWTKPEDIVAFYLSRFGDRSFLGKALQLLPEADHQMYWVGRQPDKHIMNMFRN